MHASAHTPAGAAGASIALFPAAIGLPLFHAGSTPALPVSRPARRSFTFRPACSLNRLSRSFCQSASIHVVTSMNRPDRYQPETIVAERDSHPLERGAFHGARGSRVRLVLDRSTTMTFIAGRENRKICDSSLVRTHAQSRARIKSSRARGPHTARCEFSPATVLRTGALQSKRTRSLVAYGPRRSQTALQPLYAYDDASRATHQPTPRPATNVRHLTTHNIGEFQHVREKNQEAPSAVAPHLQSPIP